MLRLSPTRTIIRGDSDKFKITFVKKAKRVQNECYCGKHNKSEIYEDVELPIDITGWQIKFTVRPEVPATEVENKDEDALITKNADILDAEAGVAMVYVQSAETTKIAPGTYYYDIQVIKPEDENGNHEVCSIKRGKYVVIGDITRDEEYFEELEEPEEPEEPIDPEEPPTEGDETDAADDGYRI